MFVTPLTPKQTQVTTHKSTKTARRLILSPLASMVNNGCATTTMMFPVMFVNHGGGPMPLMGRQPQLAQHMQEAVKRYIPEKPKAIVVLSAHWEASPIQISNYDMPQPLLYDYGGFPPETYQYQYAARGSPDLSSRIHNLLKNQGIPSELENDRGFDHGVFVPLKIMFPEADIPVVAVSMDASLDSEKNMQIGQALAPLREQGVLILGSGYTFHNLPSFFHPTTASKQAAYNFNEWLKETMLSSLQPSEMKQRLIHWEQAPGAKQAHPREEHLIPLFMTAAASDFTGAQLIYDTTSDADSEHAVTGYLFH